MADMCDHFREFMVEGTKLNEAKLKENIDNSVMMVTALSPIIGYDKGRGHLLLRDRPRPRPQAGRAGQRGQRGTVRQGRHPDQPDPPRLS
jgi:hypothetical protein